MKKMILACLALLMAFTAGAVNTSDASVLKIDRISVSGNMMDMMTQTMVFSGMTVGTADFEGLLYLLRQNDDGQYESVSTGHFVFSAGFGFHGVIYFALPLGSHNICLAADNQGKHILGECSVNIVPRRKIKINVEFDIEMMGNTNGENILSGQRLHGSIVLQNVDVTYIAPISSSAIGVFCYLKDEEGNKSPQKNIATSLEPWATNYRGLDIENDYEDGKHYTLVVAYNEPYDVVELDSLQFTFHNATNTYWTAKKEVKPLDLLGAEDKKELIVVPPEAVAVDMRGQYYTNTTYEIDVSQANPNCLYYLDFLDNVPQGLNDQCNVVRDGQASVIRLTDNYDFYCPMEFKAKYISYTLKPNVEYGAYAETLVLPFHPMFASIDGVNADYHQFLKTLRYYGLNADSLKTYIRSIRIIEPYCPYIVAVGVPSPVTFYSEDELVPITKPQANSGYPVFGFGFEGGTMFQKPSDSMYYRYNPKIGAFALQHDDEPLPPFRAWFRLNKDIGELGENSGKAPTTSGSEPYEYLWFDTGFDIGVEPIGIKHISGKPASPSAVYSLSGVLQDSKRLPKGIYIVDGKKQVVR